MATPVYKAAQAGPLGDAAATAGSAQVNQLLGTHADTVLYQGASILAPHGTGGTLWGEQFSTLDIDQPFTMSGTVIGRVAVPLLPVGNGADLLVSLCADNAGVPGTVLQQTWVPASWIAQLAAVSGVPGPSSATPLTQYTNSPVATAAFNTLRVGPVTTVNWPYPTASGSSPNGSAIGGTFGNYFVQVGGNGGGGLVANVFTIAFDGSGNVSQAVPQPAFPTVVDVTGAVATAVDSSGNYTLVQTGGSTGGSTLLNTAYAATPSLTTGAISSWSSQATMPTTLGSHGMVASGPYVYVIGGEATLGPTTYSSAVYYAQVQNGQISAWNTTTPLPKAIAFPFVAAVDGFVYVIGGSDGVSQQTAVYYAAIGSNGSLGPWVPGPALPAANAGATGTPAAVAAGNAILFNGGPPRLFALGVTANGPDASWQETTTGNYGFYTFGLGAGNPGEWQYYGLYSTTYATAGVALTPRISVPLPATGLTTSTTYHILLQQQGGDLNNYLRTHTDVNVFTGNPTLLTSARDAYSWTAATSGTAVPLQIYDQTVTGTALHTWADNGARVTTLVYATTPDQRLLGVCEATRLGLALNANQGFETGTSPWGIAGAQGTLAQSSTQVFEGGFAAQITPSGTAASVFIQSENMQCLPGQSVTASAYFWFTNAVTTNASMTVFWYNAAGSFISSSANAVSVGAAAWTLLSNTFTAPAGAYQFSLNPTLSGTPAAGQVWYVDNAHGRYTNTGAQQSSVTEVLYGGVWPSVLTSPGLGTTVLA